MTSKDWGGKNGHNGASEWKARSARRGKGAKRKRRKKRPGGDPRKTLHQRTKGGQEQDGIPAGQTSKESEEKNKVADLQNSRERVADVIFWKET